MKFMHQESTVLQFIMGAFATLFLAYTLWDTEPVGAVEEPAPVDINRSDLRLGSPSDESTDTMKTFTVEQLLKDIYGVEPETDK